MSELHHLFDVAKPIPQLLQAQVLDHWRATAAAAGENVHTPAFIAKVRLLKCAVIEHNAKLAAQCATAWSESADTPECRRRHVAEVTQRAGRGRARCAVRA